VGGYDRPFLNRRLSRRLGKESGEGKGKLKGGKEDLLERTNKNFSKGWKQKKGMNLVLNWCPWLREPYFCIPFRGEGKKKLKEVRYSQRHCDYFARGVKGPSRKSFLEGCNLQEAIRKGRGGRGSEEGGNER